MATKVDIVAAGVGVQPLGCFELPIQAVFPLRTLQWELQQSNRRSTALLRD